MNWKTCLLIILLTVSSQAQLSFEDSNSKNEFHYRDGVLVISSAMGAGSVTVTPSGENWPELRQVRFEYINSQGIKRLEGLTLSNNFLKVRGSSRKQRFPFQFLGQDKEPAGILDMTLTEVNGALTLTLPTNLAESSEFLKIHWVDVYR